MSENIAPENNAVRNALVHDSILGVFGTGHLSEMECWNPLCRGWTQARTTLNVQLRNPVISNVCTLCNKEISRFEF